MRYTALILATLIYLATGFLFPVSVCAQNRSISTAVSIMISDKDAKDGSVIVSTSKGYVLATKAYDSNVYGVYTEHPSIYLQNTDDPNTKPVTTSGKAFVLVSSINGNIKKNDFLTTSTIPGVAQKADKNGMILGTALQDYSSSDKKATGKILATINPHFNSSLVNVKTSVVQVWEDISDPGMLTQMTTLRYVLATAIVLLSFAIGFVYFGKISTSGVEALGRNPLASKIIQANLILNLVVMIVVIAAGLGLGWMILVL
jgi:hypothetical protein